MKTLLLVALMTLGSMAQANPIIMKGAKVSIDSYNPKTGLFKLIVVDEPGVGPNLVKARDLYNAIGTEESFPEFMRHTDRIIDGVYVLQNGVRLQTPSPSTKKSSQKNKK